MSVSFESNIITSGIQGWPKVPSGNVRFSARVGKKILVFSRDPFMFQPFPQHLRQLFPRKGKF